MKKTITNLATVFCIVASHAVSEAADAEAKGKTRSVDASRPNPLVAGSGQAKARSFAIPTRKVTYLGVYTEKLSPVVSRQLGLKDNLYLSVEYVQAGSPAEKAGVEKFDVLKKLDDQILVNQEQLGDLVRSRKPGEETVLTLLRAGKERKLTVKLGQIQAAEVAPRNRAFTLPGAGNNRSGVRILPRSGFGIGADDEDELHKRIREELERARKRHTGPQGKTSPSVEPGKRLRELLEKHGAHGGIGVLPGLPGAPFHGAPPELEELLEQFGSGQPGSSSWSSTINLNERTVVVSDPDGTLELKEKDGHKTLKATGPDGELIYEGPINTDAEKKSLPGDLRDRLRKLESRVKIQVLPGAGKPRVPKSKPEARKPSDDRLL